MKKYTKELKIEIVGEYKKCGIIQTILERYCISRSTLYSWLKFYKIKTMDVQQSDSLCEKFLELKVQLERKTRELEIIERTRCFKDSPRQQKLDAIEKLYGEYSTREMCRALNLDRGTFLNHHYRRVKITQYEQRDTFLMAEIKRVFEHSERRFGITKIYNKLKSEGIKVDHKKISALFKEMHLKSKHCRKRVFIQQQGFLAYLENKLNRDFNQIAPDKFWVSDITKICVGKTFFNLCVIVDLYSRKVVAHNISLLNNNALTVNTFIWINMMLKRNPCSTFHCSDMQIH